MEEGAGHYFSYLMLRLVIPFVKAPNKSSRSADRIDLVL